MDKSENDRQAEQELEKLLQNAGPDIALAARRAYENKDLDALKRLNKEAEKILQGSRERLQRSRELMVEIDQLKRDVRKLASDIRRSREGS